jgi:hypothetical protein
MDYRPFSEDMSMAVTDLSIAIVAEVSVRCRYPFKVHKTLLAASPSCRQLPMQIKRSAGLSWSKNAGCCSGLNPDD